MVLCILEAILKRNKQLNTIPARLIGPMVAIVVSLLTCTGFVQAADNPFAGGWTLETESSSLTFQSIKEKNGPKQETSSFASVTGVVDDNGLATLKVQLDSVDTKVDLRNVRMRFLFFETFKFAEATITTQVDESLMETLLQKRRLTAPIEFELDLHGVRKVLEVTAILTLFADDQLSIASVEPVSIATALFDLDEGLAKLQDAAKLTIVPSAAVSFDLVFRRNSGVGGASAVSQQSSTTATTTVNTSVTASQSTAATTSTALESSGELTRAECLGRFEILSETGAIYFRSGSAALDSNSFALLDTAIGIITRCPTLEIVVAGHTDSAGSDEINLNLSILRANSVLNHLIANGIEAERVTAIGFGETRPVAPNNSARNRGRNRRIEFTVTSS